VKKFIDKCSDVFIAKELGVYDDDDFIDSNDGDYVMTQIREKYLSDSTITIVLLGTCTHSRRYIDWEIKSSLRQGSYTPNGLIGIVLPSLSEAPYVPERFSANRDKDENDKCFAQYHWAPTSEEQFGRWIESAFNSRTQKSHLIKNTQAIWKNNRKCSNCGLNHGV
jgi:hypothetical protein